MDRIEASVFHQSTKRLAQDLLGKTLVRKLGTGEILRGIIVEVEAYLALEDVASHSYRGLGKKNRSMFMAAGTLYVYAIHSRHCMNVVSEPKGQGAAVLIRAVEPLQGHSTMSKLRKRRIADNGTMNAVDMTRGPGRLCEAFDVAQAQDGIDLVAGDQVWIEDEPEIVLGRRWKEHRTPRIGISQAKALKLRWFVDGNQFVSGLAREHTNGRTWSFAAQPS